MPRIFAPKEDYNAKQGLVDFYNGAAAVDADDTGAVAYFTAEGFDIDTNKHALTALDKLDRATLDAILLYLGTALTDGDGKYEVIRKIETSISAKYIGALTVASSAGTLAGDTNIDITDAAGLGTGNAYYYKCGATAPAPLYGDTINDDWKVIDTDDDIKPPSAPNNAKITVVKAVVDTGFILASGTATITVNEQT